MICSFLAVPLPDRVRSALTVQQFLLPLPQKTDPEQFHLTLVFLGEQSDAVLEAAHEGFQSLRAPPLVLTVQGFGMFGGTRPHTVWAGVVPSPPLGHLQRRAEQAARLAGCDLDHRRFVPHVTLGRFPPPPPPEATRLERAVAQTPFATQPFSVTELVLYRSVRLRKGIRHDPLWTYGFVSQPEGPQT